MPKHTHTSQDTQIVAPVCVTFVAHPPVMQTAGPIAISSCPGAVEPAAGAPCGGFGGGTAIFVRMFDVSTALRELNEEQRLAVTHGHEPLLVLAGAGTGKTATLAARVAWLQASGLAADRILLLTFTRRAADDMLARVAAASATAASATAASATAASTTPASATAAAATAMWGGTFHAIAHRIIRAHAEAFSLPPAFSLIDPADTADLLDTLRAGAGLAGTERRAPRGPVCADIYTRCVNTQRPVKDVAAADFPWCADFTGQLGALFRAFVAHKRAHGLVDFDDLLLLWRAALADAAAGPPCGAYSTRSSWTSTRTLTPCRPTSSAFLHPTDAG